MDEYFKSIQDIIVIKNIIFRLVGDWQGKRQDWSGGLQENGDMKENDPNLFIIQSTWRLKLFSEANFSSLPSSFGLHNPGHRMKF